jgi:hypothetical protein
MLDARPDEQLLDARVPRGRLRPWQRHRCQGQADVLGAPRHGGFAEHGEDLLVALAQTSGPRQLPGHPRGCAVVDARVRPLPVTSQ